MLLKTVFVDWHGTLSDSTFWGHLSSPKKDLHSMRKIAEDTLFGSLIDMVVPWMRGFYTTEQIISSVSQKSSLPQEELLSEFILSTKNMVVDPEVISLVGKLRDKGVKTVIATDNMDCFSRWTTPALKLNQHFDDILNSYNLKALKKDFGSNNQSLFFHNYLQENHLRPDECLLIDDSEDKNGNIQKYGIRYRKIGKSSDLKTVLSTIIGQ